MSTSAANVLQDAVDGDEIVQGRSLWVDAWRRLRRNRAAVTSLVILTVMLLICFAGPLLAPYSFDAVDWDKVATAPSLSDGHFFGTDSVGRDLFVRTLVGGQISLLVGIVATAVSLLIGTAWGATAGYLGGRVDAVMMRVVDILYALPFMFLVILLMVLFGRNIVLIFVAQGSRVRGGRPGHGGEYPEHHRSPRGAESAGGGGRLCHAHHPEGDSGRVLPQLSGAGCAGALNLVGGAGQRRRSRDGIFMVDAGLPRKLSGAHPVLLQLCRRRFA